MTELDKIIDVVVERLAIDGLIKPMWKYNVTKCLKKHLEPFIITKLNTSDTCKRCVGKGEYMYGSTSTYMGGCGGAAMTMGTCDVCWGTGYKSRTGVNLKKLREECGEMTQHYRAENLELKRINEE